ncbi:hypothetical protein [Seonamhaeicola maritimus]|uniref:hypothetical protein n=1 Tax=Seonamhaeicola maritimus TaxID=2591822 RepID=UPI002494E260|nr:hypothetical protein [Seonamhaeicola maritimus]
MKKLKQFSLILPEYFLLASVILYWWQTIILNPIAIVLTSILILQIIYKNRIIGLIIPSILTLASMYMILALISEVSEFPTFNQDAQTMLFVGLQVFLSIIGISVFMFIKYLNMANKENNAIALNDPN